jgi:hypothetical protein
MIVSNFVQGNFTVDTVLKRTESRFVGLIRETTGRPLVVKVENNPINRFEKAFYFTFFGSFTQRLFLEQNRAVRDGCVLIANVYLAIEKQSWFFPREILLVLDYFPGKVLEEFMDGGRGFGGLDGYADKIRDVFAELHRHKISMIDVNAANIIVEDDGGLKCIDLAHIYPFFFGRVVDIVKVERRLGVKVPSSGRLESIILALAKFQRSLLEFSRRHRIIGS